MEEKEIHLRDYLRVIQKRWFTVFTFFILAVTLTIIGVYTSNLEPSWRANTKLLIEKGDTSISMAEAQGFVRWDPDFLETQFQIIRSKPVALKVVERLGLATRYASWYLKSDDELSTKQKILVWARESLRVFSESDAPVDDNTIGAGRQSDEDIIVELLLANLKITPTKDSHIVNMSYEFSSPVVAAMVVNAFTRAYIEELLEMRLKATGYTVEWMTKKADEQRKRLESAEKELNGYMRRQDIVAIENNVGAGTKRVNDLSTKLTTEKTRREVLGTLVKKLKGKDVQEALSVPGISDQAAVERIRRDIGKKEQTIMEYSKKYGRKHPLMIRANSDLAMFQGKLSDETMRVIETIRTDYELAKENIQNLESQLMTAKSESITLNEKYVQYKILKRDVETYRHLYNALISKIKEQTLSEEVQPVDVWTVEEAVAPPRPVNANRSRNLLLGDSSGPFRWNWHGFFYRVLR